MYSRDRERVEGVYQHSQLSLLSNNGRCHDLQNLRVNMNSYSLPHVHKWPKHAFNSHWSNQRPIKPQPLMMISFVIPWVMDYKLLVALRDELHMHIFMCVRICRHDETTEINKHVILHAYTSTIII